MADTPPAVVRVTAVHIARGQRRWACYCPIALAVVSQCGPRSRAEVGVSDMQLRIDDASWEADLPAPVRRWVERFDYEGTGEPFEFQPAWRPFSAGCDG